MNASRNTASPSRPQTPTIDLRYLGSTSPKNIARVIINITDVDEPPIFQQPFYHFQLQENQKKPLIGSKLAKDPDAASADIRWQVEVVRTGGDDHGHTLALEAPTSAGLEPRMPAGETGCSQHGRLGLGSGRTRKPELFH